jgi:ABC-type sulfate/molybdate transport systems ATPase subunit
MTIKVRLSSITSNAGDKVKFSSSGVTCLVGGNNAGKSRTLMDIAGLLRSQPHQRPSLVVLDELQLDKPVPVSQEQAEQFLEATAIKNPNYGGGSNPSYSPLGGSGTAMSVDHLQMTLNHGDDDSLGESAQFFFEHLSAGGLSSSATVTMGLAGSSPTSPLHQLYLDGDLEEELSNLSHKIFNEYLTVDRANMEVRLRVGKVKGVEVPLLSHPTREYADAVAALPPLSEQGDGVRSYLGLAVTVLVGRSQILLVDEPEAFLHPGQARSLGRWLSIQAKERDLQVVVATHDRDFVLGLLEGSDDSVRFVRIVRDGDKNHFHELPPDEVSYSWADPVLRYSNVLQGLFHRRVVICEADADCRFYGAALDQLAEETQRRSQVDDLLLVPAAGKHGIPALARALMKLGVQTHAFVDFDVLRERKDTKAIVEALGEEWTEELDRLRRTVDNAVKSEGRWDDVKKFGLLLVPNGPPTSAARQLIGLLQRARVHIVPVGEMEGFDTEIPVKGSEWVSAALAKELHKNHQPAKDYVGQVLTSEIGMDL